MEKAEMKLSSTMAEPTLFNPHKIRCCLDNNIATPLTFYLSLEKPDKAVWQQEIQQHLHSAKH